MADGISIPAEIQKPTAHFNPPRPGGERLLFTFRTLADRTDVDWVVEESTDLVNWVPADSSFAESLFHEDGTVTHTIQSQPISPGTAAFLRLTMLLFTDD
ncbi:MAG: hypothetical protein JJT96_12035 [Opitutales bacterium]|nr:hypothetical protein [Opitutales bacterium]